MKKVDSGPIQIFNRPFVTLRELASLKNGSNMFDVKSISDYLDDEELWQLSMTHSSANGVTGKNHERLEFLGDRFLELYIADFLFEHFDWDSGIMSEVISYIVKNNMLEGVAKKYSLDNYIILNPSAKTIPKKALADCFEALIGAIYICPGKGAKVCKRFIYDALNVELKRVIDSFGSDNWMRLRKNKVMMRRMGATILEEPPTILSIQSYKLMDESETINLREGNTEEILKVKLEKYLPDFKRAVYAHIGIDQPHGRLICFAEHINTKLVYTHQTTADEKNITKIQIVAHSGASVSFQCEPKPTREGSIDVTAKIALEKLDVSFIWECINNESLLTQLKILFPHGLPIKFSVEEFQELSYEVKILSSRNKIICSKMNSFAAQAALEATDLALDILTKTLTEKQQEKQASERSRDKQHRNHVPLEKAHLSTFEKHDKSPDRPMHVTLAVTHEKSIINERIVEKTQDKIHEKTHEKIHEKRTAKFKLSNEPAHMEEKINNNNNHQNNNNANSPKCLKNNNNNNNNNNHSNSSYANNNHNHIPNNNNYSNNNNTIINNEKITNLILCVTPEKAFTSSSTTSTSKTTTTSTTTPSTSSLSSISKLSSGLGSSLEAEEKLVPFAVANEKVVPFSLSSYDL
jgi:hypothetical protein